MPPALFLNQGNHRFVRHEAGDLDNTVRRTYAVAAFDADNDGDLDLLTGNGDDGRKEPNVLFTNDGSGVFTETITGVIEVQTVWSLSLAVLDLEKDGDLDVVASASDAVRIYRNRWNEDTCVTLAYDGLVLGGNDDLHVAARPASVMQALDADGDGDLDIATGLQVSIGSPQLLQRYLYLNQGQGVFRSVDAGDFSAQTGPTNSLKTLDADRDGDQDLLVAGGGNANVLLYLNNGAGRFTLSNGGPMTQLETGVRAIAVLDADRDGDVDVILARYSGTPYLRLYLNNGQGQFTPGNGGGLANATTSSLDLLAVDIDGDQDFDLVSTGQSSLLVIYRNNGAGVFSEQASPALNIGTTYRAATLDADRDTDPDLMVESMTGQMALLLNNGAGQFTLSTTSNLSTIAGAEAWTLLDINRDGAQDLIVHRQRQTGVVYVNNGSGWFTLSATVTFEDFTTRARTLLTLDADGDGDQDLAVASVGAKALYKNDGAGRLLPYHAGDFNDANGWLNYAVTYLDFDGDSDQDLVVGRYQQRSSAYRNDGNGRFTRIDAGDFDDVAALTTAIAPFDADGDHDVDLVVINGELPHTINIDPGAPTDPASRNALYLNNGAGSFYKVNAGELDDTPQNSQSVAAFDADGDGDVDLAIGNSYRNYPTQDQSQIFLNDGHGHFALSANPQFALYGAGVSSLIAFDADGDNDMDLAASMNYTQSEHQLFFNNGVGEFTHVFGGDFGRSSYSGPKLLALDLDNDGDTDLVAGNDRRTGSSGILMHSLYFNDGTGHFVMRSLGDFATNTRHMTAISALDVNGDGYLDLAVGYEDTLSVLYLNYNGRIFSSARSGNFANSLDATAITAFDADRDGDADLAAGSESNAAIFFNENLAEQGTVTTPLITPAATDPHLYIPTWGRVQITDVVPVGTQLTYDVLSTAGAAIPGFSNLRPDAAGQISLSGLSAATYPAICLRAHFADLTTGSDLADQTARLCSWKVSYTLASVGNLHYFPITPMHRAATR